MTANTETIRTATHRDITFYWRKQRGNVYQCFADIGHSDGWDKWTQVGEVRKPRRDTRLKATAGRVYFLEPDLTEAFIWVEQKAAELIHSDDYRGFRVWPEDDPALGEAA